MGDDDQALEEGLAGPEQEITPGESEGGGILSGMLLKILKYVALGIGAIIFIVTVVIVTMNIVNRGAQPQSYPAASPEYEGTTPILAWYSAIDEIRGRTADDSPHTVIVQVAIGYEKENKAIQTELVARTPKLRDIIRSFFTEKTAAELQPRYEEELKAELRERINRIMTQGKIDEVIFLEFNVVEF
jgi:flagellar FliL protein